MLSTGQKAFSLAGSVLGPSLLAGSVLFFFMGLMATHAWQQGPNFADFWLAVGSYPWFVQLVWPTFASFWQTALTSLILLILGAGGSYLTFRDLKQRKWLKGVFKFALSMLVLAFMVLSVAPSVVLAANPVSGPAGSSVDTGYGTACSASFCVGTNSISSVVYYYAWIGLGYSVPSTGCALTTGCSVGTLAYGGPGNAGGATGTSAGAVIQNAINVMTNGGILAINGGTYSLNAQTVHSEQVGLSVLSNIDIVGQGRGVTILKMASSQFTGGTQGAAVIANANWNLGATHPNDNIIIEDLTVDGNKAGQTAPTTAAQFGILYDPVRNGVIRNVEVKNVYSIGIAQYSAETAGGASDPVRVLIDSVWVHNGGNNQSSANFDGGILVDYHRENDGTITNSWVYNWSGYGMVLEDEPDGVTLSNNHILSNFGDGIRAFLTATTAVTTNTKIQGNTICSNGGYSTLGAGILADAAGTGLDISHNTVCKNYRQGILVQGRYQNAVGITVTANICYDNSRQSPNPNLAGIQVQGNSATEQIQKVVVTNNVCFDDQGSQTQYRGFVEGGQTTGIVAYNDFSGNLNPPTITTLAPSLLVTNNKGYNSQGVVASTFQKSETGADAALLSWTPPATTGTYRLSIMIDVSAANTATIGWTATWKDSNSGGQAPTNLALFVVGVAAPALTYSTVTATWVLYGDLLISVDGSGTAIVIKTTFSGTSIAYKATATIEQLAGQ